MRGKAVFIGPVLATWAVQAAPAEPPFFIGLGGLNESRSSNAQAVNSDGTLVVGASTSDRGREAFLWSFEGAMVGLGDLPGGAFRSIGQGVSDDGAVVVGRGTAADGQSEGFRWTESAGMVALSEPGFRTRVANAVSADGSVVVGTGISARGIEAFRWTAAGGLQGLGDLPGDRFQSRAFDVDALGEVIVGDGWSGTPLEAFRWTPPTGMQGLGSLPGGDGSSTAIAVSGDGRTIFGGSS